MQPTNSFKGIVMLLLCSFIWGTAFVAQSVGADLLGPFSFNGIRSFLGAFFLVPCIAIIDRLSGKPLSFWGTDDSHKRGDLITGGLCCGLLLTIASTLQQTGIAYTSAGKAGFITALYIVIIPILGLLVKKHVTFMQWAAVAVAAAGMYFICINEGFSINKGDLIVLACAVVFAVHIMAIERFTQLVDPVRMSAIQFFVCGMLSLPVIIWAEQPELSAITAAWLPLAHAGIMSCGIAYTLQIAGQKYVNVILASILLSLESVFSVLAGWLFLGETLSMREIGGCVLVFAAILLAQMPERK